MQNLLDFYTNLLKRYTTEFSTVKGKLRWLSFLRLFAFVTTVLFAIFFRGNVVWGVIISLIGLGLFLFLVRYYEDTRTKYRLVHALIKINTTEIEVLQHNFEDLPSGEEYLDPQHPYSHDMDLFGQGSFFQYLNRTQLKEGKDVLAQLLTSNNIYSINAKQESIDELALKPEWRQHFSARASLVEQHLKVEEAVHWLEEYSPFVPARMRFFALALFTGIFTSGILNVSMELVFLSHNGVDGHWFGNNGPFLHEHPTPFPEGR